MKSSHYFLAFFFIFMSFLSTSSYARGDHSIELGYGYSHDPNHTKYNNSAIMLSGDLIALHRSPSTFWSINGALVHLHTTTPVNKNVNVASLSLALRYYVFNIASSYPAYLLGSAGPAYLSKQRLGYNTQGSHASIQTILGLGAEFNKMDVNFHLLHYSNANLAKPNEGFNVLYMLTLGYLF